MSALFPKLSSWNETDLRLFAKQYLQSQQNQTQSQPIAQGVPKAKTKKANNSSTEGVDEIMIHQKALQMQSKGQNYMESYIGILLEVQAMFQSSISYEETMTNIMKNRLSWNNILFKPYVDTERRDIMNITKPLEVEEGLYVCPKCKGKKTHCYSRQVRSADEPATTFITCANNDCAFKWKIN